MRRILLLLVLVPLALLAACGGGDDDGAASGGHGDAHGENSEVAEGARTIAVTGEDFTFEPATLEAAVGEDLAIELTAVDLEHDFVIDELDAHVNAEAGETATGGFNTGDEPGSYTYYCSVPGHREAGMEGELVVG
jgi:plastocyanin